MKTITELSVDALISHRPSPDCGDNSCAFSKSKTGMRTNSGCRCLKGKISENDLRYFEGQERIIKELVRRLEEIIHP